MSRWITQKDLPGVPAGTEMIKDGDNMWSPVSGSSPMMGRPCYRKFEMEAFPDFFKRVDDKPSRWQELKQAVRDCNRAARDAQAAADSWERMNDDIEARANEREFVQWDGGQDEMEILYDHLRDKAGFLGMTGLEMCYCGKMSSVIATKKRPTV